jgi:FkbM family methyltransferase
MAVKIPPPDMPGYRRAIVHTMKVIPSLGALSWRVANKIIRLLDPPQSIATTYAGGRMQVDITDFIGARIYHFGVWEPHLSALVTARLAPGDVFCDVGANIGYYTLLAAPIVGKTGKVVAVEPSPEAVEALNRNIALNNVSNVRVVRAAMTDRPGIISLYRAPYERNLGAMTTVVSRSSIREVEVTALPIGAILLPEEKTRLRLIKIDVEGAEGPIMQDLLESIGDYPDTVEIVCEMSTSDKAISDAPDVNAIIKRFAALGFGAFAIPNDYSVRSYLSFKSPQSPRPITLPVSAQQDVLFSRQFQAN